jgi:phospholipid transport system substrate-binding protein
VLLAGCSVFAEQVKVDPYLLVQEVAGNTFDRIKQQQAKIKEDPEVLRIIVEEELLPYVDYRFSGLKVLGRQLKSIPKDKVSEYLQVFREYLITTYAVALTYYEDQELVFEPGRLKEKDKNVTVRVRVKEQGKPDIRVAFKVRKSRKAESWKAYDMVAEGISLLSSEQAEFETILRQKGIDEVIRIMKESIDSPIKLQKEAA